MGSAQTATACCDGVVGSGIWKLQSKSLAEWYGKAYQRG